MTKEDRHKRQIEQAERLQDLLLQVYEERLKDRTIGPTEMASLQRLLQSNGWNLDPSRLPEGLKDMLTTHLDPEDFEDDDDDILPFRRPA